MTDSSAHDPQPPHTTSRGPKKPRTRSAGDSPGLMLGAAILAVALVVVLVMIGMGFGAGASIYNN